MKTNFQAKWLESEWLSQDTLGLTALCAGSMPAIVYLSMKCQWSVVLQQQR